MYYREFKKQRSRIKRKMELVHTLEKNLKKYVLFSVFCLFFFFPFKYLMYCREFKKQRSCIKRKMELVHKLEKKRKKDATNANRTEIDNITGKLFF